MKELLDMLAELIRRGADHVAAFLAGAFTFFLFYLFWIRKRTAAQNKELRAQNTDLLQTNKDLDRELQTTQQQNIALQTTNGHLCEQAWRFEQENRNLQAAKQDLESRLQDARRNAEGLSARNARLERELAQLQETGTATSARLTRLSQELQVCKTSLDNMTVEHDRLVRLEKRLNESDGMIWEQAPETPVPVRFRPLAERRMPIISLANFKGGVGKTSLTANIAAALATEEKPVLVIDLDFQGSLTSLCLAPAQVKKIQDGSLFVDPLLSDGNPAEALFHQRTFASNHYAPVCIVPAGKSLTRTENRLMAGWIARPEDGDVRYRLRSLLHSSWMAERFGCVLIDCPPRLTTACVNAFVASDFILVPVIPDRTSTEALPRLVGTLRQFINNGICRELELLGIVANLANHEQLAGTALDVWNSVPGECSADWGGPVPLFDAIVPRRTCFADAAKVNKFVARLSEMRPKFRDLADEIRRRIRQHERL